MPLRLMTADDFIAVRALLLPHQSPSKATKTLPDQTIALPMVGGMAEAIVLERLGSDWPFFADGTATIPVYYAQGDGASARILCHAALVQFACAQLAQTGLLEQLVPSTIRTLDQQRTIGTDWKVAAQDFLQAG